MRHHLGHRKQLALHGWSASGEACGHPHCVALLQHEQGEAARAALQAVEAQLAELQAQYQAVCAEREELTRELAQLESRVSDDGRWWVVGWGAGGQTGNLRPNLQPWNQRPSAPTSCPYPLPPPPNV